MLDNSIKIQIPEKIYPAEALMEVGIPMPLEFGEYKAYQIYLEMVE